MDRNISNRIMLEVWDSMPDEFLPFDYLVKLLERYPDTSPSTAFEIGYKLHAMESDPIAKVFLALRERAKEA